MQDTQHAVLLYVSDIREPTCDLVALAQSSADRNRNEGITGMLAFDGECFMQYVEGRSEAINALFGRLEADPRHHHIEVMLYAESNGLRRFPGWDLAFVSSELPGRTIHLLRGERGGAALAVFEELLLRLTDVPFAKP